MTSFEKALCRALRQPFMPHMRGTDEYRKGVIRIQNRMKAAAELIEKQAQQINDLNLMASFNPAPTWPRWFGPSDGCASCGTEDETE